MGIIPRSSLIVILLLFLTFSSSSGRLLKDYYCGTGLFSKTVSFLATAVCERETLNLCCEAHDVCYGSENGTRSECDAAFCECSFEAGKNSFCRWWLGISHCRMVQALGERSYARAHRILLIPETDLN